MRRSSTYKICSRSCKRIVHRCQRCQPMPSSTIHICQLWFNHFAYSNTSRSRFSQLAHVSTSSNKHSTLSRILTSVIHCFKVCSYRKFLPSSLIGQNSNGNQTCLLVKAIIVINRVLSIKSYSRNHYIRINIQLHSQ